MIHTKLNDLSQIQRPEYTATFEIKTLAPSPSRSSSKASKQKKEKTSKSGPSSYEFILPDDFDGQVFPDLSGQLEGEITKFDLRLRSKPSSLPINLTVNTSQTVKYQIFLQSDWPSFNFCFSSTVLYSTLFFYQDIIILLLKINDFYLFQTEGTKLERILSISDSVICF